MKKVMVLLALVAGNLAGALAQGSGDAFSFAANAGSQNHIDLGALPLGTTDFTLEFWYHANNVSSDPSILSNKDWASGTNTGLNVAIQGGGSNMDINFKGAAGSRSDMNVAGVDFSQGWNHVALSFDRSGDMTCYVNGVNTVSEDISGSTGDITSSYTWKLGQDGTGTYGGQIQGSLDEVRVWNVIRTENEIRTEMCQKLSGNEAGLLAYYNFDGGSGTSVTDLTGVYNGTVVNGVAGNRIASGAYVGDASDFDYASSWAGISLTLSSANGNVALDNVTGTLSGIHLYRVDAAPADQTGISSLMSNTTYYGVFMVGASGVTVDMTYDYAPYTEATANEGAMIIYERSANNSASWGDMMATINTGADNASHALNESGEMMLGFFAGSCTDPMNGSVSNVQAQSAEVSWDAGSAAAWIIEYGMAGFTPGMGTSINVGVNPYTIPSLTPGTDYDVYITADCGIGGVSSQVGPYSFTTTAIPVATFLGSAMALDFDGSNDWVDASNGKVSAASIGLPTDEITVECWAYIRNYQIWNAMVSFLQDNGSSEAGWDIETRDGNKIAFALKSTGSTSLNYMETQKEFALNRWYHIAATYDGTTQKLYINGNLEAESTANSGPIDYQDSWLAFGTYKDDNEENAFNGMIDEVRIWNSARTDEEIRDLMCEKLSGAEPGLVIYHRLDEQDGLTVADATGNLPAGTMVNMGAEDHVISGAAIGDDSEHLHDPADWSSVSVTMSSANNGDAEVNIVSGVPNGVHVFRVDGTPDTQTELPTVPNTDAYYGVFVSESNQFIFSNYTFEWDYSSFADAQTNENELLLLNRTMKTNPQWSVNESSVDTGNDRVTGDTVSFRKEFVLGLDNMITCAIPQNLGLMSQTPDTVNVDWTNGGSGFSNVQWGIAGFQLGTGTVISGITNETAEFEPLMQDVVYEFYVQDSCSGANSPWVGPFVFTGERCEDPTNISVDDSTSTTATLSWNGANASSWTISWGAPGFTPDWGVHTTANSTPYTLTGLAAATTYEFYVRSNCSGGSSQWIGPFQFTTGAQGLGLSELEASLALYPNPSTGLFIVEANAPIISVEVVDLAGSVVNTIVEKEGNLSKVRVNDIAAGTYLVKVVTSQGSATKKMLISK